MIFFFFCLAGITLSAKVNNNTFITAGLLAVADCNAFGSYDDIDGKEKRFENKDGEDSCAEDRGVLSSDYKQLNGTISEMDKNAGQNWGRSRKSWRGWEY